MWSIWFTLMFSGVVVNAIASDNKVWFVIYYVLMLICIVGKIIDKNKQEKRIETLEKKIKEMVGEDK